MSASSPAARLADARRYLDAAALSAERVLERVDHRFNVPSRYRNVRFGTSEPTAALKAVEEFHEGDCDGCLVLAGPTGVGKTHAAIAAFHEQALLSAEGLAVYFSMAALARALLSDHRDAALASCLEADLLVVDDVGGATYVKENGLVESMFEELLVAREGDQLATVITTNLVLAAFTELAGDRVADRLREWGIWCSLPGRSLRRKRSGWRR
jgi:DNA replication protein DnaC